MQMRYLLELGKNMDINKENYKVIFTNDAVEDMDNIFTYISEKLYNHISARKIMKEMNDAIENLRYTARSYSVIKKHPNLEMEYRRIIIKKYVIIYTIDENTNKVYIIHIYYGGSNYLTRII